MSDDILTWLNDLGLGRYAQTFAENDVDFRALPHLTEADLRELGLSLGHRRVLLAAIRNLVGEADRTLPPEAVVTPLASAAGEAGDTGQDEGGRPHEAERRLLTVLFCDLVGSTALAQRMDPEDVRDILRRYQDAVADSIIRYGGHVAKFLGDGVLAYFGWPMAHEDHAERAIRAGLEAIAAVTSIQIDDWAKLRARVGIATGQVVVGDLVGSSGREAAAIAGQTPNLAARLQEKCQPDEVLIAEVTRRLTGEAFVSEPVGALDLKGIEGAVPAFRIVAERLVESRFEATYGALHSPFIGRVHELGMLIERWELARSGQGQAILVSGEAGIGKSRLVQVFADRLAETPHELLRYQCSPYYQSSAFHPVIERLSRAAGFAPNDSPAERIDKLEALITSNQQDPNSVGAVYAELLSLDTADRYPALNLSPQQLKERILETLLGRLVLLTRNQPVVMIVEDAHWIDPSTNELFERIVARSTDLSVLVIITHRPDWSAAWAADYGQAASLDIGRLSRPQINQLIRAIATDKAGEDLVADIAERTDGIPLFVEELTRSIIENDPASGIQPDTIPATLQGSLMARLDRLPPAAKEIAQVASVIGREFARDLLKQVVELKDETLSGMLAELTRARIIVMSGISSSILMFRHALIQDVAYQSLLTAKRRHYHRQIGETLVAQHIEVAETKPELIAYHFSEAEMLDHALPFWIRAAKRALARSANYEAVEHGQHALDAVERLPDGSHKTKERLAVHLVLGQALGHAGRLPEAMPHLRTAVDQARSQGDKRAFVEAVLDFDTTLFLSNMPVHSSQTLLEEAMSSLDEADLETRCLLMGRLARAHLLLGNTEAANHYNRLAADQARRLNDQASLFDILVSGFLVPPSARPEHDVLNWNAQMDEIYRIADALDDDDKRGRAISLQIYVAAEFGDRARMDRALDDLTAFGELRQRMHVQWIARHGRAMQSILIGDFTQAEAHAEAALELAGRTLGEPVEGVYGMQMFTIRREQGRLAEVAPIIKHLVDTNPGETTWKPGFALIACDLGYREPARRAFNELAEGGFSMPIDAKRSTTLAYLAEICAALEDQARAEQLYNLLISLRRKTITAGVTTLCIGAADRYLGQLATLLDDLSAAEEHFDDALELDSAMGADPWLAHSKLAYAKMLNRRGRKGDAERARRLSEEALESAMRLDMIALTEEVRGPTH